LITNLFLNKSRVLTNISNFRWKIEGRVDQISRLVPIKNNNKIFFFGLRDQSGMIRIEAFGKKAQNYFNVIEKGQFHNLQYARVEKVVITDQIYPLINEIILAEKTQVTENFFLTNLTKRPNQIIQNFSQIKKVDTEPDFPETNMVKITLLKET
jgi:hypothetical protein